MTMTRHIALCIQALICVALRSAIAADPVTIVPPGEGAGPVRTSQFEADAKEGRLLAVAAGTVTVTGDYDAGMVVLAGDVKIGKDAKVTGPITVVGGSVDRAPGARVEKDIAELRDPWVRDAVGAFYGVNTSPVKAPKGSEYIRGRDRAVGREEVVKGTVVIAWGALTVEGRIEGSVVALGSTVHLGAAAEVMGVIVQVTTESNEALDRPDSAVVRGRVVTVAKPPLAASAPPAESAAAEAPEARKAPTLAEAGGSARAEVPESELTTVRSGWVVGGNVLVHRGERAVDLSIAGGNVSVEEGGLVSGDVDIYGGNLDLRGRLTGDANVYGGSVRVGETGVVGGDVTCYGGSIVLGDGAKVRGEVASFGGSVNADPGADARIAEPGAPPDVEHMVRPVTDIVRAFQRLGHVVFGSLFLFGLTLLVATAWPTRVRVVSDCIKLNAGRALSTGVGVLLGISFIAVVFTLATCFIGGFVAVPIVAVSFGLAYTLGWAAVAGVVGGVALRRNRLAVTPLLGYVAAGAGVLAAGKVACTVLPFLQAPLHLGFMALAVIGIGAVFETHWGTQEPGEESLLRQWAAGRARKRGRRRAWSFSNGTPPAPPPPDEDDWNPTPPQA